MNIENQAIQWLKDNVLDNNFSFENKKRTSYSSIFEYQEHGISYIFKINKLTLNYEQEITRFLHALFPQFFLPVQLSSNQYHCFSTKKIEAMESHLYFQQHDNKELLLEIITMFCTIQNKVSLKDLYDLKIRNLSFENLVQDFMNATKGTAYEMFNTEILKYKDNIQKDIDKLLQLGIINSLEHGDFHLGNILITPENNFIFIDFAEATITNPFFSLISFIYSLKRKLLIDNGEPIIDKVKKAYFEKFSLLLKIPIAQTLEAYQISTKLFNIYYLITTLELIKLEPDSKKRQERFLFHFNLILSDYDLK